MSSISVSELMAAVSPDSPCGENLEYDPISMELDQASKGKPEQQMGDTIVPAEEPDFREVQRLSQELLKRTRDLRILIHLSRSALSIHGFEAFRDCLQVTQGWLTEYWADVHPQLDPDDDNDPRLRVNTISSLADRTATLELIERAEIAAAQGFGSFSHRDLMIAEGERQPREGEEAPDRQFIEAALMEGDLEMLQRRSDAVEESIALAESIENTLTDHVGAASACSLDELRDKLREVSRVLSDALRKRGAVAEEEAVAEATEEVAGGAGGAPAPGASINGAVNNRRDVISALEKVCDYYDTHEPSSPIPLLLKGAKRLATMSFLEIVNDVTPEGLQQLKSIAGITEGDE